MSERQNLNEPILLSFAQNCNSQKAVAPLARGYSSSDQKNQNKKLLSNSDQENDNSKMLNGCSSPHSLLAQGSTYLFKKKDLSCNTARSIDINHNKSAPRLIIAGASENQNQPLHHSTQQFRQSPANKLQVSSSNPLQVSQCNLDLPLNRNGKRATGTEDHHKKDLEDALLKQKIEHLESQIADMRERDRQKSFVHDQIVQAIDQGTNSGLQQWQQKQRELQASYDEATSQLQSEQLKSKRLEEDMQIQSMTHIKLTSKLQLELEELSVEGEKMKHVKATEVAKIKRDLTSRVENADKGLKQEQGRHHEQVKDLKEKHNRELDLMQADHQREICQLEADLTQFMNDKIDLEQRLASFVQSQPEVSYRSTVSQHTNQKLLRDDNDYLKTVINQLEDQLSDSRKHLNEARKKIHELQNDLDEQALQLYALRSENIQKLDEERQQNIKLIDENSKFKVLLSNEVNSSKERLNEKDLQIKQLAQQLNNIKFNGLSSPVAQISNFNHQIMAATAAVSNQPIQRRAPPPLSHASTQIIKQNHNGSLKRAQSAGMTPDTATQAYESGVQQMPLQMLPDDESRMRRQSSAQSKIDECISLTQYEYNILKRCQIMVDSSSKMECRECGRTDTPTIFYDHIFDMNSTDECSTRQKLRESIYMAQQLHGLPRRSSGNGTRVPHNRTISSIRGGGAVFRNKAIRGSANQLFNPASTYANYANQTYPARGMRQNLTQSSAGIHCALDGAGGLNGSGQLYNQPTCLYPSQIGQTINQIIDNDYTILFDQDSTLQHHGLPGSKVGTLDLKSSMLPLQTQTMDERLAEEDKILEKLRMEQQMASQKLHRQANAFLSHVQPQHLISLRQENEYEESSQTESFSSKLQPSDSPISDNNVAVGEHLFQPRSGEQKISANNSGFDGSFQPQPQKRHKFDLTEQFQKLNQTKKALTLNMKLIEKSSHRRRKQQIELTDKCNTYNTANQIHPDRVTNRDVGQPIQLAGHATSGRGLESARGMVKNCTSTKAGQARYDFTHMMTSENAPSGKGSEPADLKQSSDDLSQSGNGDISDESGDENTSEQIVHQNHKFHDQTDQREWGILLDQADKSALLHQNFKNFIDDTSHEYQRYQVSQHNDNPEIPLLNQDEVIDEENESFDPRGTQRMMPNLLKKQETKYLQSSRHVMCLQEGYPNAINSLDSSLMLTEQSLLSKNYKSIVKRVGNYQTSNSSSDEKYIGLPTPPMQVAVKTGTLGKFR